MLRTYRRVRVVMSECLAGGATPLWVCQTSLKLIAKPRGLVMTPKRQSKRFIRSVLRSSGDVTVAMPWKRKP